MTDPSTSTSHHLQPPIPTTINDPLKNLAAIRTRLDSLSLILSDSINNQTPLPKHLSHLISSELSSSIHLAILNASSLLPLPIVDLKPDHPVIIESDMDDDNNNNNNDNDEDDEIVELDAVELLAEHIHICEVCGKGFKRDANLRMHMRAHGDKFKSPSALSKPTAAASGGSSGRRRFSCPYEGCIRNRKHGGFRALKSVVCVRNHFKRSHCPKMYECSRCHKKSFSVMADLKTHLKTCGEVQSKWRCSCGTSFSRKDKLFGHMALFEGHMPAVVTNDHDHKSKNTGAVTKDEGDLTKHLPINDDEMFLRNMLIGGSSSSTGGGDVGVDDFSMDMLEEYLNF